MYMGEELRPVLWWAFVRTGQYGAYKLKRL